MGMIFFFLTIIVIPGLPSGALVGRWVILSIACAVLFFRTQLSWTAWMLLGYAAVMSYFCPVADEAINLYWHFALLVVLYFYAKQASDIRPIIVGVAVGFWFNSAVMIAQAYGWHGLPELPLGVPSGLFFNRNMAAEGAAIIFALLAFHRMYWLIPGVIPTLAMGSRAPILALGAAGFIALWHRNQFWAIISILAALLIIVGWMHESNDLETLQQRFGAWYDAAHGLTFFGRGLGSFIVDFPLYQRHSDPLKLRWENLHNDSLQIVFEFGVVGLCLVGAFVWRLSASPRTPEFYALVVFLVEGCFGFPLYEPLSGALAAVCAGCLFGCSDPVFGYFLPKRLRIWPWAADRPIGLFRKGRGFVPPEPGKTVWSRLCGYFQGRFVPYWPDPAGVEVRSERSGPLAGARRTALEGR